jgi:hypothetical protein
VAHSLQDYDVVETKIYISLPLDMIAARAVFFFIFVHVQVGTREICCLTIKQYHTTGGYLAVSIREEH